LPTAVLVPRRSGAPLTTTLSTVATTSTTVTITVVSTAVTIVAIIILLRPYVTYLIAVVWALVGVSLSAANFGVWIPFGLAVVGAIAALAVWVITAREKASVAHVG
jgi:hypothetical protein